MAKRTDIKKILIIGSGPIIIGQACEFDYSGTQACKALREEGYSVVLINSNPATIMTDPEMSNVTYIEPLTPDIVTKIIKKESPDAILPTVGGQTALNIAIQLADEGVLEKYGVTMLGTNANVIRKAEDRKLFKRAMENIGLRVPDSIQAHNMDEARNILKQIGLPCVIRPSFTLGGSGGGVAYNVEEFEKLASFGLQQSMISAILIEESLHGWKEYELEVMRDRKDNAVIVCSIENFDPLGIHTGDSITVAPAQTLTDVEYQKMRDASLKIMSEIGVETGGSNIQFAVNPENGDMLVIEMNPRVSRSSALASKATGFPIAKIAAKLAVGYTLDEIPNDITKKTPACFEPTIDYCVVKTPRWAFEKFPEADSTLGIQMKSVGETMSIGRTFKEALQKSIRSLEISRFGLGCDRKDLMMGNKPPSIDAIRAKLITPNADRIFYIRYAYKMGMDSETIFKLTKIDPWFLDNVKEIVEVEEEIARSGSLQAITDDLIRKAKRTGFSDVQLAGLLKSTPNEVRERRKKSGITAVYKLVDTCAAEFEAYTPYYYSTYDRENEARISDRKKIMILGGGPNRIGQGIEFDYCCVHASFALKELGYETIMVNCNPETVSTDYDISDQLFFEPLTEEDVLNIYEMLNPEGVIVQFGGQTPLNISKSLASAGVRILGTSVDAIDRAEDRKKFAQIVDKLRLLQSPNGTVLTVPEARTCAGALGYPVLIRPSYVLGGRAMEIISDEKELIRYMEEAVEVWPDRPILIDKFIEDAIEVDVDAIADGDEVFIAGVMEHIEMAGIHSGDSAMAIPPHSLSDNQIADIKRITVALAKELDVVGLMNIQLAVKNDKSYVLEVNPRASRTVPFISKATGIPIAKIAAKVMAGMKLKDFALPSLSDINHFSIKESVFPFKKFPGTDIILGPEMKSTGEVMGIDADFGRAYAKSQISASRDLPTKGNVFISVKDSDKRDIIYVAKKLQDIGFQIYGTSGTAKVLMRNGLKVKQLCKIKEGRPNALDMIINNNLQLIINTPSDRGAKTDEAKIRSHAVAFNIPVITTVSAAQAAVNGIEAIQNQDIDVLPLQEYHRNLLSPKPPLSGAVV